jgi:hypothetical protein
MQKQNHRIHPQTHQPSTQKLKSHPQLRGKRNSTRYTKAILSKKSETINIKVKYDPKLIATDEKPTQL